MKNIVFILFLVCLNSTQAQSKIEPPKPTICPEIPAKTENNIFSYSLVQVKPEFPDGINNFYKYVIKNIIISDEIDKSRIIVSFVVENDGKLSDVTIKSDIGFEQNEIIKKNIQNSPSWLPAEHDGHKVRCKMTLPIIINGTRQ